MLEKQMILKMIKNSIEHFGVTRFLLDKEEVDRELFSMACVEPVYNLAMFRSTIYDRFFGITDMADDALKEFPKYLILSSADEVLYEDLFKPDLPWVSLNEKGELEVDVAKMASGLKVIKHSIYGSVSAAFVDSEFLAKRANNYLSMVSLNTDGMRKESPVASQ